MILPRRLRFSVGTILGGLPFWIACLVSPIQAQTTWIVDAAGGGDFLTIQAAIDDAQVLSGDTILILPGTYVEDVIVTKSLSFVGTPGMTLHPSTSVPNNTSCGQGSQIPCATQLFLVQANDVTITGLTLDGDNPSLPNAPDARNGIITDYTTGTWNNLSVFGCTVRNVYLRGIYATNGTGHLFQGNAVENVNSWSLQSVGLFFFGAQGAIDGNTATNCSIGLGFQGGSQGGASGNNVTGGDLGILVNGNPGPVAIDSNTVVGAEQGVQAIASDAPVSISSCTLLQGKWGVSVFGGASLGTVDVDQCTIAGNYQAGGSGVFVTTDMNPWGVEDTDVTVRRSTIRGFENGIVLDETAASRANALGFQLADDAADRNSIVGNSIYALLLSNCDDDVAARENFWGTNDPIEVEPLIFHQIDDPALGLVTYLPIAVLAPVVSLDAPPKIGTTVSLVFSGGAAGDLLLFWPGFTVVSLPLPPFLGTLQVVPLLLAGPVLLDGNGSYSLPLSIPFNPLLVGLSVEWQGLAGPDLSLGIGAFTNRLTMTFLL